MLPFPHTRDAEKDHAAILDSCKQRGFCYGSRNFYTRVSVRALLLVGRPPGWGRVRGGEFHGRSALL